MADSGVRGAPTRPPVLQRARVSRCLWTRRVKGSIPTHICLFMDPSNQKRCILAKDEHLCKGVHHNPKYTISTIQNPINICGKVCTKIQNINNPRYPQSKGWICVRRCAPQSTHKSQSIKQLCAGLHHNPPPRVQAGAKGALLYSSGECCKLGRKQFF